MYWYSPKLKGIKMWADQCINVFKMKMESLLWKNWEFDKAIRQLSMDSDIPEDVLRSWWNGSYKKGRRPNKRLEERFPCRLCKENIAEVSAYNKRTYSSQLCLSCRKKVTKARKLNEEATFAEGTIRVCPRCSFSFLTKEKEDGRKIKRDAKDQKAGG